MATEIIIKRKSALSFGFEELWQYRELLYFFTWKDIKVRYKQAFLGFLWTIIQPLFLVIVFVYFLGDTFIKDDTLSMPKSIYYFSGLLFWNFFAQGVSASANSMVSNANIIKKIYFPRLIISISAVLTAAFDFLMTAIVFIVLVIYTNTQTNSFNIDWLEFLWSLTMGFVITFAFTVSVGTLLAAINVKYRDVRYAIPFMIQTLFFLSPVIYTSTKISDPNIRLLYSSLPINYAIELCRNSFLPTDQNPGISMILVWCIIVIFIFFSIFVFRKVESYMADII